jgi:hypothetical protein
MQFIQNGDDFILVQNIVKISKAGSDTVLTLVSTTLGNANTITIEDTTPMDVMRSVKSIKV